MLSYKVIVIEFPAFTLALTVMLFVEGSLTNSYHQPSGVVQARCVTGIYPYVSPGNGVPSLYFFHTSFYLECFQK